MFNRIDEINNRDVMKFYVCGYEAVDTERQLSLSTTNGRVKHTRKWFVRRYVLPSGRTDYNQGQIMFRAVAVEEAIRRVNEPDIQERILVQFGVQEQ